MKAFGSLLTRFASGMVCCSMLQFVAVCCGHCGVMFVPFDYDGSILLALESDCLLDGVLHSVAVSCSVSVGSLLPQIASGMVCSLTCRRG